MRCTRCLSRVRRPHGKAPPAKLHPATAHADREDDPAPGIRDPAPGIRSAQKELALWPAIGGPGIRDPAPGIRSAQKELALWPAIRRRSAQKELALWPAI